jgi:hypothetical protein
LIVWLREHFEKFGDQAPNRDETYLIITAKRNIYNQYVEECKQKNLQFVQESVFSNIWSTIFPHSVNRNWCDIPGLFFVI